MNEKEWAYFEDTVNELTENLEKAIDSIYNDEEFEMPNFDAVLEKRTLNIEQAELLSDFFAEPFAELYKVDDGEDKELNEKYQWLSEGKRKKLISVMDTLVKSCVSVYTELQPEFQELKENFRKIAENEKEEAQQAE
jgi:rubrerythrin|tara:strand:- start:895 stop:1305 length:411 start_codon:yes stop_codon:yes gene_type:complete